MGVKYLVTPAEVNTVRPQGYRYPVGLTISIAGTPALINVFTSSGTWASPSYVTEIETLVVAGGGAAAAYHGGGGGAGGLLYSSNFPVGPSITYTVTIGAGGSAGMDPHTARRGVWSFRSGDSGDGGCSDGETRRACRSSAW